MARFWGSCPFEACNRILICIDFWTSTHSRIQWSHLQLNACQINMSNHNIVVKNMTGKWRNFQLIHLDETHNMYIIFFTFLLILLRIFMPSTNIEQTSPNENKSYVVIVACRINLCWSSKCDGKYELLRSASNVKSLFIYRSNSKFMAGV